MTELHILHSGESAFLAPEQSGFAHGYGIFETMRLKDGRLCFWAEHWKRLVRSAAALALPLNRDPDVVLAAVAELTRNENLRDGTIKLSLLRDGEERARLFVYARPLTNFPETAGLYLDERWPMNPHSPLAGHKTHNYMENMLVLRHARGAGYDDAVRVNVDGALTETTVANLFFFRGGTLCTPSLGTGALPGIVRGAVIEVACSSGITLEEGAFSPACLREAELAFVTNASCGMLPVERIEGQASGEAFHCCLPSSDSAAMHLLRAGLADAEERAATPVLQK
ncbi:MAG: aminotransferase class IV [Opitutales bacterium]